MKRRGAVVVWVVVLATSLGVSASYGAAPIPDSGFGGGDGVAVVPGESGELRGVSAFANGGVGASRGAGGVALKLRPDGSPDPAFGGDGVSDQVPSVIFSRPILALPGGGVLLGGGKTGNDGVLVKLTPSGSLDPSFDGDTGSGDGVVAIDLGQANEEITRLAALPGGDVVAAGTPYGNPGNNPTLVRVDPDGKRDTAFDGNAGNGNGRVSLGFEGAVSDLAIDPSGRIVMLGVENVSPFRTFVARFLADGRTDPGFGGGDGLAFITLGDDDFASSVSALADGKILVGGSAESPDGSRALRLLPNGDPDTSFAPGGVARVGPVGARGLINGGIARPDGGGVFAGSAGAGSLTRPTITRVTGAGAADPSFGPGGVFTLTPEGYFTAATLDAQGRLVAAGRVSEPDPNDPNTDIVRPLVARYYLPADPVPARPDTTAPRGSRLRLRPASFRAASRGASVAAKKVATGARLSFRLTEAGVVRFRVERRLAGRRVGKRCVKPRRSNRKRRKCARYKLAKGSFTVTGKAGANSFKFRGRLRGRKLKPGRYRLVGRPTDASGNRGKVFRAKFRILKPAKKRRR